MIGIEAGFLCGVDFFFLTTKLPAARRGSTNPALFGSQQQIIVCERLGNVFHQKTRRTRRRHGKDQVHMPLQHVAARSPVVSVERGAL